MRTQKSRESRGQEGPFSQLLLRLGFHCTVLT